MDHFDTTIIARGHNVDEAEVQARAEFYEMHGRRHDISKVTPVRMIAKVPPRKHVLTLMGCNQRLGRPGYSKFEQVDDETAPESEWLEQWEFAIHSHA
ncbi:MAG: hypothetical protein KKB13_18875 [Chloroflexi bacterium]|nr:hypothetical protein [Chloroflexota bacterium]